MNLPRYWLGSKLTGLSEKDFDMRTLACIALFFLQSSTALAWGNGQSGNAQTDKVSECNNPPYSTHDFVADHALFMLPSIERSWLEERRTLYLLGTEAPDNDDIPLACGGPHTGYDDKGKGHSVEWAWGYADFRVINGKKKDRAAVRAQEEYDKAVSAYNADELDNAAFYLGAMAHYIGDVSQYGHSVPFENIHSPYESWVGRRTKSRTDSLFNLYISVDNLVRRRPYTAVKRISKITAGGKGDIYRAFKMDSEYANKSNTNVGYMRSIGKSINLGANELADVLHTFYLNVVNP